MIEKALSIRQPWAHAIVHLGKDIENRDWKHAPSYRGPILIHASAFKVRAKIKADLGVIEDILDRDLCEGNETDDIFEGFKFGGIIGRARIVGIADESDSPWFFGPWGFMLADIEPLPFYRCDGALGFFDVDMSLPPKAEPIPAARIAKPRVRKEPTNQGGLFE